MNTQTQDRIRALDRDQAQPGIYAPSVAGFGSAALALTANNARVARFVPTRDMVVALIAFGVTTAAGADDACDVGIYDSAGTRIVSAGATTGKLNSLGVKTVAITPTKLTAGTVYYAAFSCGTLGGTAAQVGAAAFASGTLVKLMGSTSGVVETDSISTAHPLPATVAIAGNSGTAVFLALRES